MIFSLFWEGAFIRRGTFIREGAFILKSEILGGRLFEAGRLFEEIRYMRCWNQWRTDELVDVLCPSGAYEKAFWWFLHLSQFVSN